MQLIRDIQSGLLKATFLIILFFGSLGPVFRSEITVKYIGAACTIILAGLALTAIKWKRIDFGKSSYDSKNLDQ